MQFQSQYSTRCPAVKRLLREAQELAQPTEDYYAQPLEDNLFEWHFTVRGPPDTEYEGGLYHGRIVLPPEYPMKPPNIIILTPSGRFEVNSKICLSISRHHPETWQPSWSIRTALLAIIGFMPTAARGSIGALNYTPEERKSLARRSQSWECEQCGKICNHLVTASVLSHSIQEEARELATQINFKGEGHKLKDDSESQDIDNLDSSVSNSDSVHHDCAITDSSGAEINHRCTSQALEEADVSVRDIPQVDNNTSNIFIGFIVIAIALLLCRRAFLAPLGAMEDDL